MRTFQVLAVAFLPGDAGVVATGCKDCSLRVWEHGVLTRTLPKTFEDGVRGMAFSPDGARLLAGSYDGTSRLFDTSAPVAAWAELASHTGSGAGAGAGRHTDQVMAVACGNGVFATTANDHTTRVYCDARSARWLWRPTAHGRYVQPLKDAVRAMLLIAQRVWDAGPDHPLWLPSELTRHLCKHLHNFDYATDAAVVAPPTATAQEQAVEPGDGGGDEGGARMFTQ